MSLLPTQKTPRKTDLSDTTIMIYGPPKIGKSTLASEFPKALFLATEEGLAHVEVFQTQIDSWARFKAACAELAEGKHDFRTVVIDTIDNLYRMCADAVCAENKVKHVGDIPGFGKGYALVNNEFHRVLTALSRLPYGLILVSHSKQTDVETPTGSHTKTVSTLPESARRVAMGLVDMILYCTQIAVEIDGEKQERRAILTKPARGHEAGDRTGKLPPVIPMNFKDFKAAFDVAVGSPNAGGGANAPLKDGAVPASAARQGAPAKASSPANSDPKAANKPEAKTETPNPAEGGAAASA
ncbi:AAA family ATPase [bacterium]|nr:AAA family ATPase [bacterium]